MLVVISTGLTASALTFLVLRASFDIISLRREHKIILGDGGNAQLAQAIRSHANLLEYAPLALIGLGCLELNGVPSTVVGAGGAILVLGRVLHYRAMRISTAEREKHLAGRVLGMQLTLTTLGITAVSGVCWTLWTLGRRA